MSASSQHSNISSWFDNARFFSGISHKVNGPSSIVERAKLITDILWQVVQMEQPGLLLISKLYLSISSTKIEAFYFLWQ